MFIAKPIIVFFLSGQLSLANPLLHDGQNGVTCQTSNASPSTEDVIDVINQVRGKGGDCPNTNGAASDCTTLVKQNSAAIGICGEVDDDSSELTCAEVASYANEVQQACLSNGRVGGTYTINSVKSIIVFGS